MFPCGATARTVALALGTILPGVAAPLATAADVSTIRADLASGNYARAETEARAMLAVLDDEPDPEQVGDVLDILVEAVGRNGTFMAADARTLAERAVALREARPGRESPETARSARNLADVLFLRAEFAESAPLYDRAVEILRRDAAPDRIELALTLAARARLLWVWQGRHDPAAILFDEATRLAEGELDRDDPRLATILAMSGDRQREAGAYDDALDSLRRSLAIRERSLGTDHPDTALSRVLLARVLYTIGQYDEALSLQEAAQPVLERTLGADHPECALARVRLALSLWITESRLDEALEQFGRAADILEASVGPDHPWLAVALNYRGNLSLILGDASHARSYLERALAIRLATFGPDHPFTAMSANNLGGFHKASAEYHEADRLYSMAARVWEMVYGPGHYLTEGVHANIGDVRMLEGDLDGAEMPLRRALHGLSAALGPDHRFVAYVRSLLGRWTMLRGDDPVEAKRLLENSIAVFDRDPSGSGFNPANAMIDLATLLERDPGERSRAHALHRRALRILQDEVGPGHPTVARSLQGLARVAALDGDLPRARDLALEAEDIRREHTLLTARLASERDALRLSPRGNAGLDLALSFTPDRGEAVRIAWDRVIRARALVFDELARRQRDIAGNRDPETERLVEKLGTLRARLASVLLRGSISAQPAGYRSRVAQLRAETDDVERKLAALSMEFRVEREQRQVGFDEVRSSLTSTWSLVAYVRYSRTTVPELRSIPEYLALILATPESEPILVRLGDAAAIDRRVDAWMQDLSTRPASILLAARSAERDCRVSGRSVRQSIWDPVAAHLPPGRGVLVIPDGTLHLVNFSALPGPDDRYLLEGRPGIHVLSSEKDLTVPSVYRPGTGLLVAGDPDFDGSAGRSDSSASGTGRGVAADARHPEERTALRGPRSPCPDLRSVRFERLPGSRREVADVTALWRGCADSPSGRCDGRAVVLTGAHADEKTVRREASGKRVIHLATHGFFSTETCSHPDDAPRGLATTLDGAGLMASFDLNPLTLSGLALAGANRRAEAADHLDDGVLTAGEVASLDLTGVEWAVLSGCDTGRGDVLPGEGVLGFRRAFRLAGARTVVITLWPVQDEIARDWVQRLYAARTQGSSTADAVRKASLDILHARRESGESTHPFFWAAFVAEGDWR